MADKLYALGGTSTFSVRFADAAASLDLALTGRLIGSTEVKSLGNFAFDTTINALTGNISGSIASGVTGSRFNGNFFGPAANEVGGTFSIDTQDPGGTMRSHYTGVTVAKKTGG